MKLNLGHTIGHGVEAKSHYAISHGQAVSIGMAMVARAASKYGMCSSACCRKIRMILEAFQLPVTTGYSSGDLFDYIRSDKKRQADTIRMIIPREIGCCEIVPMPVSQLKSFIEAGL